MKLKQWFDRIVVINRQDRPERLSGCFDELERHGLAAPNDIHVQQAVIGSWVTPPADWNPGSGSWGCLRSFQRAMEDAMHVRNGNSMAVRSVLFLEDDVFFVHNAGDLIDTFMSAVPSDWGQIYLGGQHMVAPTEYQPGVVIGESVNRCHAMAISAKYIQRVYRHICYATDYLEKDNHQLDHQLEVAHRRKDWPVYCPDIWIAGQKEGRSDISEASQPQRIW